MKGLLWSIVALVMMACGVGCQNSQPTTGNNITEQQAQEARSTEAAPDGIQGR